MTDKAKRDETNNVHEAIIACSKFCGCIAEQYEARITDLEAKLKTSSINEMERANERVEYRKALEHMVYPNPDETLSYQWWTEVKNLLAKYPSPVTT
jgi:hypothetical protein